MKIKRGPLSNDDKKYIDKYKNKKTVEELSKKLKKTESLIEKYLAEPIPLVEVEEVKPEPAQRGVHEIKSGDLLARKESHGSVSMTMEASMLADEKRKLRGRNMGRSAEGIFIIKKNK